MHFSLYQITAVLLLTVHSYCLSAPEAPLELLPVNIRDWDHIFGKRHRRDVDFADLTPKNYAQLIWGKSGAHANMMLHAEDGQDIVLLESFDGLTKKVDCKGDDGSMSLTFNSPAAFEHALKYWSFVNGGKDKRFLLIANHKGCGPDDQRQPYIITNIKEDKSTLTTHLASQIANWQDVAKTFEMDFGHVTPSTKSLRRIRKRFGLGDLGQDLLEGVFGEKDPGKPVGFDVALGDRHTTTGLWILDQSRIFIDCIDCGIQGHFGITGRVTAKNGFYLPDFIFDTTPQNTAAALKVRFRLVGSNYFISDGLYKVLFRKDVPKGGMKIAGIIKIAVEASYGIGVNGRFQGRADFTFGLEAKIPDGAQVQTTVGGTGTSTAVGFDQGSMEPFFSVNQIDAGVQFHLYSELSLKFGIDLFIFHGEADLNFRIPSIRSELVIGYEKAGMCTKNPGSSTTGVRLFTTFDPSVRLATEVTLGSKVRQSEKYHDLWAIHLKLEDLCVPIDIPGLNLRVPGTSPAPDPTQPPKDNTAPFPVDDDEFA